MNKLFLTPGPSQLFPTVLSDLQQGYAENIYSVSHRSQTFENLFESLVYKLRNLLNIPNDYHIFFVSSGTEAMERIIENCVSMKSFHFVNGAFSKRFFLTAQELKKNPQKIEVALGEGFNFSTIIIPQDAELICITHNETSTGVMLPLQDIYDLKKRYPKSLFALDIVSSVPYGNIDFSQLDCVFFSVQKGFGLPAGLGIIIVSPSALAKSKYLQEKGISIGSYHTFPTLMTYAMKYQTPETPSTLHMFLLDKVLQNMLTTGIKNIQLETDEKAKLVYRFLDNNTGVNAFVKEKRFRSPTVIVIQSNTHTKQMKNYLVAKGIYVGSGYGTNKDIQLRVANFPAITVAQMKKFVQQLSKYSQP